MVRTGPATTLEADPKTEGGRLLIALKRARLFNWENEEDPDYVFPSLNALKDFFRLEFKVIPRIAKNERKGAAYKYLAALAKPVIVVDGKQVRISLEYVVGDIPPILLPAEIEDPLVETGKQAGKKKKVKGN